MPIPTPVLTDGVVTLRVHRPDDIDEMIAMGNDAATTRWTTAPVPYERSHAEEWVELSTAERSAAAATYRWAIEADDNGTPRFAGNIDLRFESAPDIGYALAPWARGNGYMQRAVRLVTQWAFETLDLGVVQWSAHVDNWASWRVAHACGFTFHGTIPLSHPQRGALRDGWFASLRPGDDPTTPRTKWLTAAILSNDKVRLRPLADTDVPRIIEACSDERTRRWLRTIPHPYTEEAAGAFVRSVRLDMSLGQRVGWAVTSRDDDRLLGNIAIFRLDNQFSPNTGEIGYWAHPDARGRGAISAAVELVVEHGFTPVEKGGLGRRRIQIGASWANTASRHVAERNGFTLVGRTRKEGLIGDGDDAILDDGAWYDLLIDES